MPSLPKQRGLRSHLISLFFFNDTATTEIYTLSLHDALPICGCAGGRASRKSAVTKPPGLLGRSEEHTSDLQSPRNLVCRLLLEKKKHKVINHEQTHHVGSFRPVVEYTHVR